MPFLWGRSCTQDYFDTLRGLFPRLLMVFTCILTVILFSLQVSLLEETIKPRTNLPPLLVHLRERRSEKLHYIGVSFGLTLELLRFWRKHKFAPFYVGHNPVSIFFLFIFLYFWVLGSFQRINWQIDISFIYQNSVTGEHTCMVLKPLDNDDIEASETDDWGFFSPFYHGGYILLIKILH